MQTFKQSAGSPKYFLRMPFPLSLEVPCSGKELFSPTLIIIKLLFSQRRMMHFSDLDIHPYMDKYAKIAPMLDLRKDNRKAEEKITGDEIWS